MDQRDTSTSSSRDAMERRHAFIGVGSTLPFHTPSTNPLLGGGVVPYGFNKNIIYFNTLSPLKSDGLPPFLTYINNNVENIV